MTLRKPQRLHQDEMYRVSLLYACWPDYPLVKLAEQMHWEMFEEKFGELYCPDNGRTGLPIRMMVGLLLLNRRRAIEPVNGHIKHDGMPGRNYLKGIEGYAELRGPQQAHHPEEGHFFQNRLIKSRRKH